MMDRNRGTHSRDAAKRVKSSLGAEALTRASDVAMDGRFCG